MVLGKILNAPLRSSPPAIGNKFNALCLLDKKHHPLRDNPEGLDGNPDQVEYEALRQIAVFIDEQKWPIYLYGPVGTGKSCAAAAVYRHWPASRATAETNFRPPVQNLVPVTDPYFVIASEITSKIAHADYSGSDGKWKHYKRCREANLLVVDDIGRRKLTDDQAEILLTIVEERRQNPTIYTSNFRPDELAEKLGDDRLASRILRGMNMVEFTGPDRRLE